MESSAAAPSPPLLPTAAAANHHLLLLLISRLPSSPSLVPALSLLCFLAAISAVAVWLCPGGPAWGRRRRRRFPAAPIPGPRGIPVFGSLFSLLGHRPHVALSRLASSHSAARLMAFSIGCTPAVVTSHPSVARDLLSSPSFADRPIKQSARLLLFHRAIGFAPYGDYWRKLRRIAATHLFSPRRLAALEPSRQLEASHLIHSIHRSMLSHGSVHLRPLLHLASINNIMTSVFGRRYDFTSSPPPEEALQLRRMTRQGFELLGAFNWSDHLPFLRLFDFQGVDARCRRLVADVQSFVQKIVDEHRLRRAAFGDTHSPIPDSDFVDVLLSLQPHENLSDTDIIAILWEMIFRGTDTIAILIEWMLAEMVLHPEIQRKAQEEIDAVVGRNRPVADSDIPNLRYVQSIVKETLRLHPPGPLLSWARLAITDTEVAGHEIPAGTTAMVNMWAITHDKAVWGEEAGEFRPERFMEEEVDVRGGDLRLAPFGAGRRVCPGRAMGMATVHLWAARLLQQYDWEAEGEVKMEETLKLSCEMRKPLVAKAGRRVELGFFAGAGAASDSS